MRIVIFGATGRVGTSVVQRALERGHDVVGFARDTSRIPEVAGLTAVQGSATDPEAVARALEGADAAIAVMGSGTLGPTTDLSDATRSLIEVMRATGPRRLVLLAHVGVFLKKVDPQYEHVVTEHRRNFEAIKTSGLDWVAVCPPGIVSRPGTGAVQQVVEARAPEWEISREDLADFLVSQVSSDEHVGHAVGVSN